MLLAKVTAKVRLTAGRINVPSEESHMSPHSVCCGGFFVVVLPQNADILAVVFLYWNIYIEGQTISYSSITVRIQ